MKKLLLASVLVVGISTMAVASATENYSTNMSELEASYQSLQAEEQALLEARRAEAVDARERLAGQKGLYAQVSKRVDQIDKYKDLKFFKEEYKIIGRKYNKLKKDLDGEIKAQEKLVADLTDAAKPAKK